MVVAAIGALCLEALMILCSPIQQRRIFGITHARTGFRVHIMFMLGVWQEDSATQGGLEPPKSMDKFVHLQASSSNYKGSKPSLILQPCSRSMVIAIEEYARRLDSNPSQLPQKGPSVLLMLQNPLIKEYTLNHIRVPIVV